MRDQALRRASSAACWPGSCSSLRYLRGGAKNSQRLGKRATNPAAWPPFRRRLRRSRPAGPWRTKLRLGAKRGAYPSGLGTASWPGRWRPTQSAAARFLKTHTRVQSRQAPLLDRAIRYRTEASRACGLYPTELPLKIVTAEEQGRGTAMWTMVRIRSQVPPRYQRRHLFRRQRVPGPDRRMARHQAEHIVQ